MKVETPEGLVVEVMVQGDDVLILETDSHMDIDKANLMAERIKLAMDDRSKRIFVLAGGVRLRILRRSA